MNFLRTELDAAALAIAMQYEIDAGWWIRAMVSSAGQFPSVQVGEPFKHITFVECTR